MLWASRSTQLLDDTWDYDHPSLKWIFETFYIFYPTLWDQLGYITI